MYDLPLDRYLNLVHHWMTDGGDPDEVTRWEDRLWAPPPGWTEPIPAESPWSAESEASAFAAFAAQTTGTPTPD